MWLRVRANRDFESVNAITGDYQPYLGTIVAPPGASAEAAAIQAAYRVLSTYFPASASTLDAQRASSMAAIPDGQAKNDGIATGEAAASAMIALRANDGSSPSLFKTPGLPVPGEWQATPSCPIMNGTAVGTAFQWQNVTPFGVPSASAFFLGPPPALTSNTYAKAYNEVVTVGSIDSTARPQDRTNVVLFYASSSPTLIFNQAAGQIAQQAWHQGAHLVTSLSIPCPDLHRTPAGRGRAGRPRAVTHRRTRWPQRRTRRRISMSWGNSWR